MIKELKRLISGLRKESRSKASRQKLLSIPKLFTAEGQPIWDQPSDDIRMYILVNRPVLPLVHCVVQSSHAAADFVFYHHNENTRNWVVNHKTMIILEATELQMVETMNQFASDSLNYQPFWEPDMSNVLTAVAFQPMKKAAAEKYFSKFDLLS